MMGRMARELKVKRFAQTPAKPGQSTTAFVTRRAGCSHSWIPGRCPAPSTAVAPCSLVQGFVLTVSISPGFSKLVTSIVTPSSPLLFPIRSANGWMVSSLAERSLNAVSLSSSISGVVLEIRSTPGPSPPDGGAANVVLSFCV